MSRSKEVDAWFTRYDNPMKPVVQRVRAIVLGSDARIEECIKWQAPTFAYHGNLASFFPKSKQHASLMFHTGALIPGEHPLLEGGGDTSRVMKIGSLADAESAKRDIERVVRAWCDWRDSVVAPSTKEKPSTKRAGARRGKSAKRAAAKSSGSSSREAGYDESTADRIRTVLGDRVDVVEKRMFGGLCFMVNGRMCYGLTKTAFMVRVGKDAYEEALSQPHARPMDFTGRPLTGMVYVDAAGYKTLAALGKWVRRGVAFVTSEPAASRESKRRPG